MKINNYKALLSEFKNKTERNRKEEFLSSLEPHDSVIMGSKGCKDDHLFTLSRDYLREKFNYTPVKVSIDTGEKHQEKTARAVINDEEITLNIKHTNDIHGNMPHIASLIEPDEFWIDAGDAWQGYNFRNSMLSGVEEINMMNARGCDLAVPGNHFYDDRGIKGAMSSVRRSDFPYISANTGLEGLAPYSIAEIEGIKIGFIGIETPKIASPLVNPGNVQGLTIGDPLEAAKKSIEELKSRGVDNIIIISHLGLENKGKGKDLKDMELAANLDGIDLIIGGHSHTPTLKHVEVNGTRIVHAGIDAHLKIKDANLYLGDLNITLDRKSKKIKSIDHRLIKVEKDIPLDDDIRDIRAKYLFWERSIRSKPVGSISRNLTYDVKSLTDSPLGNMITDAIREETGADVALLGSTFFIPPWMQNSGIHDYTDGKVTLSKGNISNSFLERSSAAMGRVQDVSVETFEISGKCMKEMLEKGITKLLDPLSGQGLYQVSGLKMLYDPAGEEGNRIKEIYTGDEICKADKNYKISTCYIEAQHNSLLKSRDHKSVLRGRKIRHIVADYIRDGKAENAGGKERICVIS